MVDKTEVNLAGVKQNKNVWLVKVCLKRKHKTMPFWLLVTGEFNGCVAGVICKSTREEKLDPFAESEIVSRQVPKYLSVQWEKAAEKGEVGKISIGKQVGKCVDALGSSSTNNSFALTLPSFLCFLNMQLIWQEARQNRGEPLTPPPLKLKYKTTLVIIIKSLDKYCGCGLDFMFIGRTNRKWMCPFIITINCIFLFYEN